MLSYLDSMSEEFSDLIDLRNSGEVRTSIPAETFSILRKARVEAKDAREMIIDELKKQIQSAPTSFEENENAWWSFVPAILMEN